MALPTPASAQAEPVPTPVAQAPACANYSLATAVAVSRGTKPARPNHNRHAALERRILPHPHPPLAELGLFQIEPCSRAPANVADGLQSVRILTTLTPRSPPLPLYPGRRMFRPLLQSMYLARILAMGIHSRSAAAPLALVALLIGILLPLSAALQGGSAMGSLKITSTAFEPGAAIPKKFTCEGPDVSPALSWSDPPAGAQSFALIADDPDAPVGTWVHWVLYDLPADARSLAENIPKEGQLPNGARQGRNDFRKIGYGGPCPPPGKPHRYFFKLYALDAKLNLKAGATKTEAERAMQGHILAQGELIGRFAR